MSLRKTNQYKYHLVLNLKDEGEEEIFQNLSKDVEAGKTVKSIILKALENYYRGD